MLDPSVAAHLEISPAAKGLAVAAYVVPVSERPLRWRLIVTSKSAGGTSNVSQGGIVRGHSDAPVGTVTVSRDSTGSVTLVVLDGAQEVAHDSVQFGASSNEKPHG